MTASFVTEISVGPIRSDRSPAFACVGRILSRSRTGSDRCALDSVDAMSDPRVATLLLALTRQVVALNERCEDLERRLDARARVGDPDDPTAALPTHNLTA